MQRCFLRPKRIILLNLLPLSSSMFSFTQIVNNLELEQNLNNTQTFLGLRMPVKNSPFKLCSSFFAVTVKAVFHCFTLRRLFSIHLLVCGQEIEFLHNAAIITFSSTTTSWNLVGKQRHYWHLPLKTSYGSKRQRKPCIPWACEQQTLSSGILWRSASHAL